VARLRQTDRVRIELVTELTWLKNLNLPWNHGDPADRTTVATAGVIGCPLITSDQENRSFYADGLW
jgi:PIN domain nuclease of toxin-antitoxin system